MEVSGRRKGIGEARGGMGVCLLVGMIVEFGSLKLVFESKICYCLTLSLSILTIVSSIGYLILSGKMHVDRQDIHFFTCTFT